VQQHQPADEKAVFENHLSFLGQLQPSLGLQDLAQGLSKPALRDLAGNKQFFAL
jgi:hypothetical protein